jgi:hypothetical protein
MVVFQKVGMKKAQSVDGGVDDYGKGGPKGFDKV